MAVILLPAAARVDQTADEDIASSME